MANNKFCTECGQRLEEGVKFCPNCGNAVPAEANGQEPQNNTYTMNDSRNHTPDCPPNYTPGFSTRIHDPEIKAALRRTRSISRIFLLISIPIPVVVASIYALVTKEMELGKAIIGGAVVSGIILLINFLTGMSHSAKNAYEAVVIDKKFEYTKTEHDTYNHVYKTIVRTTDGRKKVIEETSHIPRSAYEYLCVGDRFRYHPQLAYPYEKYDKSKDGFVYCACCMAKNDLSGDRCQKCGVPLLK